MALKLMDPINTMPFFQANQVLTYNHLNELASYLYQQERYTRNKLIGSGIVCALTFSWKPIAAGNAEVLIDDGCAVTSAGYLIVFKQPVDTAGVLIPYTHRRNFTRLKDFEPFKTVVGAGNPAIYELITKDVFDSETSPTKAILTDANKTNRVLILLYDIEALNIAKCLDESCDDKGKIYQYTPRPLLVPIAVIDDILNAPDTQPFFTEPGRSAKAKQSLLFETDYLYLKNLFKAANLMNVSTQAQLVDLFKAPCLDPELAIMSTTINNLVAKFPWIFDTQFNCMKIEVPALAGQNLGSFLQSQSQAFRNNAANNIYMQYLYDFLRDVVDAYNELYAAVSDLVGECGGNEFIHPFHVMLGRPTTNDTLSCYHEVKYNETNFKYRHYFVPSPVMDGQFMLYEKTQSLFKRLIRIIANFSAPAANDIIIKVTPSKDYDRSLGDRAIPYFYLQAAIENIRRVWNYDATRRNKISRIKGYKLPFSQDQLLEEDTSKNDFYRIEGHIGSNPINVKAAIDTLRTTYNLPFSVTAISIQPDTKTVNCSYTDLDEEYNYYRDRVLGYLKEIQRWLAFVEPIFTGSGGSPETKKFFQDFKMGIDTMAKLLKEIRCINKFPYDKFKIAYLLIWEAFLELYANGLKSNTTNATQAFNIVLTILNLIFFAPIYKIWYFFQYRLALLKQTETSSLKLLAGKTTGLEHLAGVRRGETFLLVTDTGTNTVVADFNMPDLLGCSCDCKTAPCDGKNLALVSPLEKPIIMVVDYNYKTEKALIKQKAFFDPLKKEYVLELDDMGFYKGDTRIDIKVKVVDEKGTPFNDLQVTWQSDKLVMEYFINENPNKDGIFKLFYELTGDFEEKIVEGIIFLVIIGRVAGAKMEEFNVPVEGRVKPFYPYDKEALKKTKPEMKFEGDFRTRVVGGERVKVYTTPTGNEFGIYKDKSGLSYIKVINAKTPGVEEIPFILEAGGTSSRNSVYVNVIDKKDKLRTDTLTGVITDDQGQPLRDVKLTTSTEKEAVTDERGQYKISGLRAGEVITVERKGYKRTVLQVNSRTNPEVKLQKAPLIDIKGLEDVKLFGNIGSFAEGIDFNALKNFIR
ncbi:carboxypeptidase-like regulatory domain-containing protein [Segetibacter aerophilus]|uniref:Carboxypeptidase regulatory-like domain-containing protein n=1 Tax=Segetibacter aerophilus TaxID=670293 RepID=A0A512BJC6_9BACT|nr:carboxypeptidase-like regulatory domain-containing protein [Segetibacter aerophilus]GEO11927.1 hypothetical protein SAE01_44230 [Segetibacter aerophilus]